MKKKKLSKGGKGLDEILAEIYFRFMWGSSEGCALGSNIGSARNKLRIHRLPFFYYQKYEHLFSI